MDNISILPKTECCGCTACYSTCPTSSIKMSPDEEGFLYPVVDEKKCINCGLCLSICKKDTKYNYEQRVYAIKSKDSTLRMNSSSGGVFSLLANTILKNGGVVCGVAFDEDMKGCHHEIISSTDQLDGLRRSKFIQSNKKDTFATVKELLDKEVRVLFCGTPCEVGGIRGYLRKEYENLLTCDLICGCVSSPMVYKKYITFMNEKYASRAVQVNFKDKRAGWREKGISIKFENGSEYYNSILDDDYVVSFHSRYNIRPSCFHCKQRSLERSSDITLGDFWGIENYNERIDDNKGLSFVLVNTHKGEQAINCLRDAEIIAMEIDIEDYAIKYNWCLHRNPTGMPQESRSQFYKDVVQMDFSEMAKKDLTLIKEKRKKKKMKK